jgi:predicted RNA polymerase sigma factor
MTSTDDTGKLVDHLFRREAGKMVAILTHFLGLANLQLAEDVVQDAFVKALQAWKLKGMPDNPEAWLIQVAKNKAIDLIRRKELHDHFTEQQLQDPEEHANSFFHSNELEDSQLRMIFACCHPGAEAGRPGSAHTKTRLGFFNGRDRPGAGNNRGGGTKKNFTRQEFFTGECDPA